MSNFRFRVALDARVYGEVEAEADSLDEALELCTSKYISDKFVPDTDENSVDPSEQNDVFIIEGIDDDDEEFQWTDCGVTLDDDMTICWSTFVLKEEWKALTPLLNKIEDPPPILVALRDRFNRQMAAYVADRMTQHDPQS